MQDCILSWVMKMMMMLIINGKNNRKSGLVVVLVAKKSSGYGKYKFFRNPKILNGEVSKYRDVLILTKMINMDMSVNRGKKIMYSTIIA